MTSSAPTTSLEPGVACDHCKHVIEGEVGGAIERAGYAIASEGP